jgi:Lectin C-type domain
LKWAEALKYCEDRGMNLATFDSFNEGSYFDGVVKYSAWIGVRDNNKNGQFLRITDGKNVRDIIPWRHGQPSGNEYCVHSWDGHHFNDLPCNSNLRFACEMVENN